MKHACFKFIRDHSSAMTSICQSLPFFNTTISNSAQHQSIDHLLRNWRQSMSIARSTVLEMFGEVRIRLKQALVYHTSYNPHTRREHCLIQLDFSHLYKDEGELLPDLSNKNSFCRALLLLRVITVYYEENYFCDL